MGSGSATVFFFGAEISAFIAKIFFSNFSCDIEFNVHSQIFEFDISIQILIWIFGSTYRKGEILKQK